jgi:hypothetical protein
MHVAFLLCLYQRLYQSLFLSYDLSLDLSLYLFRDQSLYLNFEKIRALVLPKE